MALPSPQHLVLSSLRAVSKQAQAFAPRRFLPHFLWPQSDRSQDVSTIRPLPFRLNAVAISWSN